MAHVTGIATSAADLYQKLADFLTTNEELVTLGQQWVQVWTANGNDRLLRGPGLAGQEQVYVGMKLHQDPLADNYWIELSGATGLMPNSEDYHNHINSSPTRPRMFLDSGTMEYWFVANGRRFMCVVKISTVFESCYCGLFMPYATPLQYPYPLFIGGSAGDGRNSLYWGAGDFYRALDWRSEAPNHRHFITPHSGNFPYVGSSSAPPCAMVLDAGNNWRGVGNVGQTGPVMIAPENAGGDYFFTSTSASASYGANFMRQNMVDCFGGKKALIPATLVQTDANEATYGVLEGAYRCQGYANQAENIIQDGGVDHLVVQNVFRSTVGNFWAMALE